MNRKERRRAEAQNRTHEARLRKDVVMQAEIKRVRAVHEAGHAVIARALGVEVEIATLEPDMLDQDFLAGVVTINASGVTHYDDLPAQQQQRAFEIDAIISLAGPLAQKKCQPTNTRRDGWCTDIEDTWKYVFQAVLVEGGVEPEGLSPSDINEWQKVKGGDLLSKLYKETAALVDEHWPAIQSVAEGLLKRPSLNQDDIDALIARIAA